MPPFPIGSRVKIATLPPYLKTTDTMPMLRPPDLVVVGEEGTVLEQKTGGYWAVRFERGSFLIDTRYLLSADADEVSEPSENENDEP